ADKAPIAAQTMGMTAPKLQALGIIDSIIPEPLGGAHRHYQQAAEFVKKQLLADLTELNRYSKEELLEKRYQKLMSYGYC
ncbi:acetyl-CoA carboxylase carboxyl transferase subunit alpha, partial [Proteus mirabilis]